MFGSVSTRDIAGLLKADGAEVGRSQIVLNAPIKTIGQYKVPLALHPEVEVSITVTVARSADEAQRIARGEDVTVRRTEAEEEAAAAAAAAEAMFDPEAKARHDAPNAEAASPDAKSEEAPAKPAKAKAKTKKKTTPRPDAYSGFFPPSAGLASPAAGTFALVSLAFGSGANIPNGFGSSPGRIRLLLGALPLLGLSGRLFLCLGLGFFVALGRSLGCPPWTGGPASIDLR